MHYLEEQRKSVANETSVSSQANTSFAFSQYMRYMLHGQCYSLLLLETFPQQNFVLISCMLHVQPIVKSLNTIVSNRNRNFTSIVNTSRKIDKFHPTIILLSKTFSESLS
jgi:hypothetical protein